MDKRHHLFVSATGGMLPRWREAFPIAQSVSLPALTNAQSVPAMVWLRLVPGVTVAEQIALVRSRFGQIPVCILSDTPSDDEALAAFSAAAKGYCNAHAAAELLAQVASVVMQGGIWIGENLMQRLLGATARILPRPPAERRRWEEALTEREIEVARAVSSGASNKEIAQRLGITERTVKAHIGAIFEKLDVRDRLQLALLIRD